MEKLILYLAAHFIGDFAFQTTWMATNKGKSWLVNFCHAATYAAAFALVAKPSLSALLVIFITHFWIDPLGTRWKVIKSPVLDQILHLLVIAIVLWFKL